MRTVRDAYLLNESGQREIDWQLHNLHLLEYSIPVDRELTLEKLQPHLHSLQLPEAIPYITSYYSPRWGFCLSQTHRDQLLPGRYRAVFDSILAPGSLT